MSERKHNLFVEIEESLREVQEKLLWWVEARNRAKGLLLWALKSSPESVCSAFELLRDAYKEIEDYLGRIRKIRDLQLQVWRVEEVKVCLNLEREN